MFAACPSAARYSDAGIRNAVVLEVASANLPGCLTPIGHPQNLFLFHRTGWTSQAFVAVMFPFVCRSGAGLFAMVFPLKPRRAMVLAPLPERSPEWRHGPDRERDRYVRGQRSQSGAAVIDIPASSSAKG